MLKLLAILIFIYWVYRIIRKFNAPKKVGQSQQNNMVACGTCGIYVPQSEAVVSNKNFYCCRGHIPK